MSLLESATTIQVDRDMARDMLRKYREAKAPATGEDQAIMTAYRQIARGQVVIQAAESIRNAGWNEDGTPKLAMTRANIRRCQCQIITINNIAEFSDAYSQRDNAVFRVNRMPDSPPGSQMWRCTATVPLIPLHLRPKHDLRNYWILWEANWIAAPVDPLLLRRLQGDLWLVLAAWELTDVERAVLEQRVHSA